MNQQIHQNEICGDISDTSGSVVTSDSDVTSGSDGSSRSNCSSGADSSGESNSFTESDSSGESDSFTENDRSGEDDTSTQSDSSGWSDETRSEVSSASGCSTGCNDTNAKDSGEYCDGVSNTAFEKVKDESVVLNSEVEISAGRLASYHVTGRTRPPSGFYSECQKSGETGNSSPLSGKDTSRRKKTIKRVRPGSSVARVGKELFDVNGILTKRQKQNGKFQFRPQWTPNIYVDESDVDAPELLAEFNSKELIQVGDRMWEPVPNSVMSSSQQSNVGKLVCEFCFTDQHYTGVAVPGHTKK